MTIVLSRIYERSLLETVSKANLLWNLSENGFLALFRLLASGFRDKVPLDDRATTLVRTI